MDKEKGIKKLIEMEIEANVKFPLESLEDGMKIKVVCVDNTNDGVVEDLESCFTGIVNLEEKRVYNLDKNRRTHLPFHNLNCLNYFCGGYMFYISEIL